MAILANEDHSVLHRPTMHRDEDRALVQVYDVNCESVVESVVGIYSGKSSIGSGFVWDDDAHIITNWHVIQNASDFRVSFRGGKFYGAKVVGFCKSKDVAVLCAVELKNKVKPVSIGSCANLRAGYPIFVIGSPFGLDNSLVIGGISFLGRVITSPNGRPIRDVIQIWASINPGNSGGPLFDRFGRLIGINTAIETQSGAFCGVGYSISIDSGLQKIDPYAGILGDFITSVDGEKVTNDKDLLLILDRCNEGDQVTVEVLRGGQKKNISVTLEPSPDESESKVMLSTGANFKC